MPSARQILCLYLPHWSITRRFRRQPQWRDRAVLVIREKRQRRFVVDASETAQRHGIKPGMSAAEARALLRGVIFVDEDVASDRRSLEALGRWLTRFTPVVSCAWDDDTPDPPAAIWMDLTGCDRLFQGISRLAERIATPLKRFGLPFGMAIAPTVGSAWAFARTARLGACQIIDPLELPRCMGKLPVATLRLSDAILSGLHHLGLHTAGDVLALPRGQLPARFGALLGKRLDQLTGEVAEPLNKLVYDPPIGAKLEIESPLKSPEMLATGFRRLFDLVLTDLKRRGHGVRRLQMTLTPDRGWGRPIERRQISLSRPHRHRATLLELIDREIERIDCEHGYVRLRLDVPQHEPIEERQAMLFQDRSDADQMEFELLLQRLRARLGDDAVVRPYPVESYLPERAWRAARDEETIPADIAIRAPARPPMLFETPQEIPVMSEPSDDRVGSPRQFTWRRDVHRLTHVVGPERIAGEWWRGHRHTRDYYEVENESGQRFWIFRVLSVRTHTQVVARWFLHGRFD